MFNFQHTICLCLFFCLQSSLCRLRTYLSVCVTRVIIQYYICSTSLRSQREHNVSLRRLFSIILSSTHIPYETWVRVSTLLGPTRGGGFQKPKCAERRGGIGWTPDPSDKETKWKPQGNCSPV